MWVRLVEICSCNSFVLPNLFVATRKFVSLSFVVVPSLSFFVATRSLSRRILLLQVRLAKFVCCNARVCLAQFCRCTKFVLLNFFVATRKFVWPIFLLWQVCLALFLCFNLGVFLFEFTINQTGVSGGNMERSKIAPQSVRFTASPLAGRRASLAAKELGKERDCSQSIYSWSSCYC